MFTAAILFFALLFLWTPPTRALQVNVPEDFPSIQEAVDFAADGDTIYIHAYGGPYWQAGNEWVRFYGKNLHVSGVNWPVLNAEWGSLHFVYGESRETIIEEIRDRHRKYARARQRARFASIGVGVVALGLAVIVGYVDLYGNKATFGSGGPMDYVALFVWGFGSEATSTKIASLIGQLAPDFKLKVS